MSLYVRLLDDYRAETDLKVSMHCGNSQACENFG